MRPEFLFTLAVDPRRIWRAVCNWRWHVKGRRMTRRAQALIGAWSVQQQRVRDISSSGLERPPSLSAHVSS